LTKFSGFHAFPGKTGSAKKRQKRPVLAFLSMPLFGLLTKSIGIAA